MSRTLDDNMVVDCGEGEKSPTTTTCQHSTKPLTAQREEENGGSQSRKTKMNGYGWFLRVLLV